MKAIDVVPDADSGKLPPLRLNEVADPAPGRDEVVIAVESAGVNPADVLQRRGMYPPPPGASDVLGLEVAGRITAVGSEVAHWQVGQRVAALLDGGGYAELAVAPSAHLLPVPDSMTADDAASLPEALCTAWSNLVGVGALSEGETVLVHGGSGGVGAVAVQLALALGARVVTTAGGEERVARCRALAPAGKSDSLTIVDYRSEDFVEHVKHVTDGRGADVILDVVGAAYLDPNVRTLAVNGRLIVIGMQKGRRGELDLGALLARRAAVYGTTLRSRPAQEKAAIVADVREHAWPLVVQGLIRPTVHARLPLEAATQAHEQLLDRQVFGKIVLNP